MKRQKATTPKMEISKFPTGIKRQMDILLGIGLQLWRIKSGKGKLKTNGENGNQAERLESIGLKWPEK